MSKCLDLVRRNIEDLSQQELDEVLKQLKDGQADNIRSGLDADSAAAKAGRDVADKLRMAKALARAEYLRNRAVRLQHIEYLRTTWAHDPIQGVESIMVGSLHSQFGSRSSVSAAQGQLKRMYRAGAQFDIEATGALHPFRRGELDRDIYRALDALDRNADMTGIPPDAVKLAKAMAKWYETTRLDANRNGAHIGKLEGYAGRQVHNARKIERAGEAEWTMFMQDNLDFDRMRKTAPDDFVGPTDMRKWFQKAYRNVTTGVRDEANVGEKMAAFTGPGNLAKKMSAERVFHFKTPEAAFEYNKRFGMGNLAENFFEHLAAMGDRTGLLKVLGTNPEYNLNAIVRQVAVDLRDSGQHKLLTKFENKTKPNGRFDRLYRTVSGATKFVANNQLATITHGALAYNTWTGLGGLVLSQIGDLFQAPVALRSQGQSFFGSLSKSLIAPVQHIASSLAPEERKALWAALGYHNEVQLINAVRWDSGDNVPGAISSMTNHFFKYIGATGWTDSVVLSVLQSQGNYFGNLARDLDYTGLSMANKRVLERYRITQPEWDILRKGVQEVEGRHFLTGDGIRQMDAADFAPLAQAEINSLKAGIAQRVTRRLEQDQREQGWVDNRAQKLQEGLADALEKLEKRLETADVKTAKSILELRRKLGSVYDHIDTQNAYWQTIRERIPSVAQTVADATTAERSSVALRNAQKALKEETSRIMHAVAGMDEEFRKKWESRFAAIESEADTLDYDTLNARLAEMDQAHTEANAALTAKVEGMEQSSAEKRAALAQKIERSQVRMMDAKARLEDSKAATPTMSEMRRNGVSEGRAKAAAVAMKKEVREIAHQYEKWKRETHEEFVEKWSDRQDDLTAFADGVNERIATRARENARDLGKLEPEIQKILENKREDMASRLQTLYADEVDSARIMPDARSKAFLEQGTSSGTPLNTALKVFLQFKSYGHAMITRGLMKEIYGYSSKSFERDIPAATAGVLTFLASGVVGGFLAAQTKQLAAGKKPRPADDPKTWLAAATQFGGFGIYGDFLFGNANRQGANLYTTLGGPLVGKGQQLYDLYTAASAHKEGKGWGPLQSQAVNFLWSNTPGNNFPAVNLAIKYGVLWKLQESANPGYLQRMEKNAKEQTGADWWLPPTSAAR